MTIFDIEKDKLRRLNDADLEELVFRLAEAEIEASGHGVGYVSQSGSINAPDEGIDIHVNVPAPQLGTGFFARPNTIIQVKNRKMSKHAILKEMAPDGNLSPTISQQAANGGSYIIVSPADNCSPRMKRERLEAMQDAVKGDSNNSNIHLDFFDLCKLHQWLRQHSSVMIWLKGKFGQDYSGWRPYAAWSNPPNGAYDEFITAPGVAITLPDGKSDKLSINDAIGPMRDLIRNTGKAVRITGLSGVGKTRIVQALFDETVGSNALEKTIAVYVDTGADHDPSPVAMLEKLLAEEKPAILILDNCSSELHFALASKVSNSSADVGLITIEYDIQEDEPQTTDVIHIEANESDMAEELLVRRFPDIGPDNARRVAKFTDGNARISLAVAERVEKGESLAKLSDAQLFDRIFEQRKNPDRTLRKHAEILSLVYSFSVDKRESGLNELEVLGSFLDHSPAKMFRSVNELRKRHVVQQRSHWRAILPHVIANRLAASALENIPVETLREVFETPGHERLLMSFGHRLGFMHDHDVAKEIVEAWLQPNGLFKRILSLRDAGARILSYIAPVAPDALIDRIEAEINAPDFTGMEPRYANPGRTTIINLLHLMAYEDNAFERCVRLLVCIADYEDDTSNNYMHSRIVMFFQARLSGTHASLEKRLNAMQECIKSDKPKRRSLGFQMLSAALRGPPWRGSGMREFGARPRNFGYCPNFDELVEWRCTFIDVAVQLGTSGDTELEARARETLADRFRDIWHQEAMREKLVNAARVLHAHKPWIEGYKAVRLTINLDYTKTKSREKIEPLPESLAALEKELEPKDLVAAIKTYVLSSCNDYRALNENLNDDTPNTISGIRRRLQVKAQKLGEEFAASGQEFEALGPNLFAEDGLPYRMAFGRGLAKGSHDRNDTWQALVEHLGEYPDANFVSCVFAGFICEIASHDSDSARGLLDQCANHPQLRRVLVELHPAGNFFTEADLDRCMGVMDNPEVSPWMFKNILWRDEYKHLPIHRIVDLAERLLLKPAGDNVVLYGLYMKRYNEESDIDPLGANLRRIGLVAASQRIARNNFGPEELSNSNDRSVSMKEVVDAALRFDGNEKEKATWLDAVFALIDKQQSFIFPFEDALQKTAALMPKAFLDRVFVENEEKRRQRLHFIHYGTLQRHPLAEISIDTLIGWCRDKEDMAVWTVIAAGICLWWGSDEDEESALMTEAAIKLLEAAPDPVAVLKVYADRLSPTSWSGSRASVMQRRADAIKGLSQHQNADIAKAAKAIYTKMDDWVKEIRIEEQRENKKWAQKFEWG